MSRAKRLIASVLFLTMIALAASGCSLFGSDDPVLKDVAEYSGAFHFQIPEQWQVDKEAGLVAVYAAEELPTAEDAIDTLSILVFTSNETTSVASDEMLAQFVEQRSVQRGWVDPVIGDVQEAQVGGRDGYRIDVEATNPDDLTFDGRFYMVRTAGRDVMIITVAPIDVSESFDDDIDTVLENWFWHLPEDGEPVSD